MRILMQLSRAEANERQAALAKKPDDNTAIDEAAHQVAEMVEESFGQGLVEDDTDRGQITVEGDVVTTKQGRMVYE